MNTLRPPQHLWQCVCPDGSTSAVTCLQRDKEPPAPGYSTFPVVVVPLNDTVSIVDRVAQALFDHHQDVNRSSARWDDLCEDRRQHWYGTARVALAAAGILPSS